MDRYQDLLRRTEVAIAEDEQPSLRSYRARAVALPTWLRWLFAVMVYVAGTALIGASATRVDLGAYPPERLALDFIVLTLPVLLAAWVVTRPLHRPLLHRWQSFAIIVGTLAGALTIAALPTAHSAHPAALAGLGADFWPRAGKCLLFGLGFSIPMLVTGWMLRRQPWFPAVAWVLAGLSGMAALHLTCPLVAPAHLLFGHASVVFVALTMAAIGAVLARARVSSST